jgi:hypothetical protein
VSTGAITISVRVYSRTGDTEEMFGRKDEGCVIGEHT